MEIYPQGMNFKSCQGENKCGESLCPFQWLYRIEVEDALGENEHKLSSKRVRNEIFCIEEKMLEIELGISFLSTATYSLQFVNF